MLNVHPHVHFIAVLHSNILSIEFYFSLMRWLGADNPLKYECSFNYADNEKSMKRLKGNPMYEEHEETNIRGASIYGDNSGYRVKMIHDNEVITESDKFIDCFSLDGNTEKLKVFTETWADIKKAVIYGSYKQHLLQQTNLRDYCKAGINTQQETSILCFLRSQEKKEELQINKACQNIMTCFLFCLDTAITYSNNNVKGSFW